MFGNFCKEHATLKVRENCLSLLGRRLAHVSVFLSVFIFLADFTESEIVIFALYHS